VINPGPYATSAELINPARKKAWQAKRRESNRERAQTRRVDQLLAAVDRARGVRLPLKAREGMGQ